MFIVKSISYITLDSKPDLRLYRQIIGTTRSTDSGGGGGSFWCTAAKLPGSNDNIIVSRPMLRHRTRVIICSNLGRVRVESRITPYHWMKFCEGAVAKSQILSAGIQLMAFA